LRNVKQKQKNNGILEYWNIGMMDFFTKKSLSFFSFGLLNPLFHCSIIPPFQNNSEAL
jgi:hypothetical protein